MAEIVEIPFKKPFVQVVDPFAVTVAGTVARGVKRETKSGFIPVEDLLLVIYFSLSQCGENKKKEESE